MNILVKTIGGATFSRFMVAIQSINTQIDDISKISTIYIEVDLGRVLKIPSLANSHPDVNINPFNFVLVQSERNEYDKIIMANNVKDYTNHDTFIDSNDLSRFKLIIDKIKIKETILDKIPSFNKKTIGVHVRLTDMPHYHPQFGKSSTKNYITKIKEVLTNDAQLFVASDNYESLEVIKKEFKNTLHNDVNNRSVNGENDIKYWNYLASQMTTESHWVDSFIDMLTLAKCNELIYRPSNLNTCSIIFSNTIIKAYKA